MTGFDVERLPFDREAVQAWARSRSEGVDWPVVYVLDDGREHRGRRETESVYVGETLRAAGRLQQHLDSASKAHMTSAHVIIDPRANKSACLDLESYLIRLLAGDGRYRVLNQNQGVVEAQYFDRDAYRRTFEEVFERLREEGLFTRDLDTIRNDALFKLSPFTALTAEQTAVVEQIMQVVAARLLASEECTIVLHGPPGTGKTVVAIFLLKLIADLRSGVDDSASETESPFASLFDGDSRGVFTPLRTALVIPQQSLRESVQKVFRATPGLRREDVVSPFQVGSDPHGFGVLVVDEAHRLSQRASLSSAGLNAMVPRINERLFGQDDVALTQLDWIEAQAPVRILLVDERQSVLHADLPRAILNEVIGKARDERTYFRLVSQMRVRGGEEYVERVRHVMDVDRDTSPAEAFGRAAVKTYDLRFFDDLGAMHDEIRRRDGEVGLSRLVAGYAWPWRSRGRRGEDVFDIELDGRRLRWNGTDRDWIASAGSLEEVGSIHTVQGYDLNYAGVIIGRDLGYDPVRRRLIVDRSNYFDARGKQNNRRLGRTYTDDDLVRYVADIYGVLLTRGIRGTYVHVVDPALRRHLRPLLSGFPPPAGRGVPGAE